MRKIYILIILTSISLFGCQEEVIDEPVLMQDHFSSDLFFSEYLEGDSYNKALEVKNLTGQTILLEREGYSIKKQSNGKGPWIGELLLTGMLAPNDVFVISNASAGTEILEKAHQLKAGAPMDFNGNDPVGLFKNGILIDLIGEVDNPAEFGKNLVLKRKQEYTEPSANFIPEEWEVLELNNAVTLGDF